MERGTKMDKVKEFKEFKKIWEKENPYRYWGYKKITEEKRKELEEKYYITEFKENNIYKINNLYFIMNNKPKISNEILYNDELETPNINDINVFIDYNISMNFRHDMSDWVDAMENLKNNGCCSGRYELKPYILRYSGDKITLNFYDRADKNQSYLRDMTQAEIKEYLKICADLKAQYIERLEKYYKKYRNKITTLGYWANR